MKFSSKLKTERAKVVGKKNSLNEFNYSKTTKTIQISIDFKLIQAKFPELCC